MIGNKSISNLSIELERNLKKELRDQGHYLTGALERSIASKVTDGTNTVLEITAEEYIEDLETGIPGSHIDVSASYIQELAEYARKRFGAEGKQALKIGYLIAKKHKREGMPTINSYQFSITGDRKHAIEDSYQKNEEKNEQVLENSLSVEIDQLIDKTFDQLIF